MNDIEDEIHMIFTQIEGEIHGDDNEDDDSQGGLSFAAGCNMDPLD